MPFKMMIGKDPYSPNPKKISPLISVMERAIDCIIYCKHMHTF